MNLPGSYIKTRHFRVVPILLLLAILPAAAFAQEDEALAAGLSYASFQTGIVASGFVPEQLVASVIMAGSLGQTLPLWFVDTTEGALYTGLAAAGFGGYYLAPKDSILSDSLADAGIKMGLWSGYRTYAAYREQVDPGWQPERFADLMTAPFDWEDLNTPAVWTVLAAGTVVNAGFAILTAEDGQAVWDTGTSFLGDTQVHPAVGLPAALGIGLANNSLTGATEEALYRGVQYEVLTQRYGDAARWIDSLAFAAIHVPGDIYRGVDPFSIGLTFLYRGLVSLGLQWAYDSGGLQSAAALHTWLNVFSEVAEFMTSGGVSRTRRTGGLEISPMSIGYQYRY